MALLHTQFPNVRNMSIRVETVAYIGNKLWQFLPQEIKQSSALPIFKKQISNWNGDKCNRRLWSRIHLQLFQDNVNFVI